jgi:hypothetical protein
VRPWEPDLRPIPERELQEADRKVGEEFSRVGFMDWAVRALTGGILWALYERLGKPIAKNLDPLAEAKITREHAYGKRRPGGALAQVENIGDVLPFDQVQRNMLKFATKQAAEHIQKIDDQTRSVIRQTIIRAKMDGTSSRDLAEKLRLSFKNLDRDWRRVAITESHAITMNGYLMSQGEGQKLLGQSRPDACQWCKQMVHGKIFTVTHAPPNNPDDPANEHLLWPGKHNVGRVRHLKDSAGKRRQSHELWHPCIPMHSSCRCTWVSYNPQFHVVGADGFMRARSK